MMTLRFSSQLSTYRYFSSGENAKPFGPVTSLLTSFSSPVIKQDCKLTVLFETRDAAVAVFVDGETPLGIEREAIGTGLAVFADVHSCVAAVSAVNGDSVFL